MFAIPQVIGPDLAQRLSATHRRASTAYLAAARLALEELLRQPDAVATLPLTRKRHGYARTLLFGDGKLSLWAMAGTSARRRRSTTINAVAASGCLAEF